MSTRDDESKVGSKVRVSMGKNPAKNFFAVVLSQKLAAKLGARAKFCVGVR